jgi:hypothetical protein
MVEALYLQTVLAVMPEDDPLWRELTRCKRQLDCRRITGEDVLGGNFIRHVGVQRLPTKFIMSRLYR